MYSVANLITGFHTSKLYLLFICAVEWIYLLLSDCSCTIPGGLTKLSFILVLAHSITAMEYSDGNLAVTASCKMSKATGNNRE